MRAAATALRNTLRDVCVFVRVMFHPGERRGEDLFGESLRYRRFHGAREPDGGVRDLLDTQIVHTYNVCPIHRVL